MLTNWIERHLTMYSVYYRVFNIAVNITSIVYRAVARSEILGGLVVLGGDNVSPLVEIGLADLPNIGGAKAPPAPTLRRPCE